MKDAYSFDRDTQGMAESYQTMYDAYTRIFKRLGLETQAVEADSGTIGGNFSHEFHVMADSGEDAIALCSPCDYAANVEKVNLVRPAGARAAPGEKMSEVDTPNQHTMADLCDFLAVSAKENRENPGSARRFGNADCPHPAWRSRTEQRQSRIHWTRSPSRYGWQVQRPSITPPVHLRVQLGLWA